MELPLKNPIIWLIITRMVTDSYQLISWQPTLDVQQIIILPGQIDNLTDTYFFYVKINYPAVIRMNQ